MAGLYSEPWRIQQDGGPYADTLIVTLPKDRSARRRLFAIASAEARREGFDPERDTNQAQIVLWWD